MPYEMTIICRVYLTFLSIYHIVSGVISYFCPSFAMQFYKWFYGCDPVERKHLALILKPWGALAFFSGICGMFAAADPVQYAGVVVALWLLLAMRIAYRILCRHELNNISRISSTRNLFNIALILVGVVVLGAWLIQYLSQGRSMDN